MTDIKEMKRHAIEAIEKRAFEARIPMGDVCDRSPVTRAMWSTARTRGSITVVKLAQIEEALGQLIYEKSLKTPAL